MSYRTASKADPILAAPPRSPQHFSVQHDDSWAIEKDPLSYYTVVGHSQSLGLGTLLVASGGIKEPEGLGLAGISGVPEKDLLI